MIKELHKKYPSIYRDSTIIIISKGWLNILEDASEKLEKLVSQTEDPTLYYCKKVLKDHGEMRFSFTKENYEMNKVFSEVILISKSTCEICGEHGVIRGNGPLKSIVCDKCVDHALNGK